MHRVVIDTLTPWVSVDCPSCGLEDDLDVEDVYVGMSCYCGYRYTKADLADRATLYAPDCDE